MPKEVFIPKMTDFMEAGVIVNWLIKEGEWVEKGQPFLEIETDKATAEVEAPASGYLKGIRPGAEKGTTIPVGETIAFIASSPDEQVPILSMLGELMQEAGQTRTVKPGVPSKEEKDIKEAIRATPVARRIAKELGVNLALVGGSGPEGRITEKDVRLYASSSLSQGFPSPLPSTQSVDRSPTQVPTIETPPRQFEWLQLNNIQRLTGQHMLESTRTSPQFALTVSVDMSNVLALQDKAGVQIEAVTGKKVSITGILVKVVASSLKAYPRVNASFMEGNIKIWKQVNIGVAIGTENGLVVPVIKNADQKSLKKITSELSYFQEKALKMRFSPEELSEGTFTISNLGMYGIDRFNAIINPPEAAILAVGRIVRTPVVTQNDTINICPIAQLTLTIDHRCLDGLQGAQFLNEIKIRLENLNLIDEV